jgi:hypothetical protein
MRYAKIKLDSPTDFFYHSGSATWIYAGRPEAQLRREF